MQPIHHTHTKQANKLGVQLELQPEYNLVKAFWPERSMAIFGADAKWALEQMKAAQAIIRRYEGDGHEIKIEHDPEKPFAVRVMFDGRWLQGANPPALWNTLDLKEEPHEDGVEPTTHVTSVFKEDPPRVKSGIPTSGRIAHQNGFSIIDCPFEDDDDGPGTQARWKWEEEWEASADEATAEPTENVEEKAGSVVKSKYRAKYAEAGHPTHCGDELANYLNSLVIVAHKTDVELFDAILTANGVDMSKYSKTSPGWQGRYRMTGRNMLARIVHAARGELKMPETINGGESVLLSPDWVGSQRFK